MSILFVWVQGVVLKKRYLFLSPDAAKILIPHLIEVS